MSNCSLLKRLAIKYNITPQHDGVMRLFEDETVSERVHREVERDILRMQGKIVRFQNKLRHLQDIFELTKPIKKTVATQLDMFGT